MVNEAFDYYYPSMQKIDDPGGLLEQCGAADPTETIDEMERNHTTCATMKEMNQTSGVR